MNILITGVAGFIGFNFASFFLKKGNKVCGIDNLDKYYSVGLKKKRISILKLIKTDCQIISKIKKLTLLFI